MPDSCEPSCLLPVTFHSQEEGGTWPYSTVEKQTGSLG